MKPLRRIVGWSYREGILTGYVGGELKDIKIVGLAKESEDTLVVESEDTFYILNPPDTKNKIPKEKYL